MIPAVIVRGHRVASGLNGDARFPGGTIRMQVPHFAALGFDLSAFHPATLNVSIAPLRYRMVKARHTFRDLKWHPVEPAETFSFFEVAVHRADSSPVNGWIYFPHPETKPEHFQKTDVLELLLPWLGALGYGDAVLLDVPSDQMAFEL